MLLFFYYVLMLFTFFCTQERIWKVTAAAQLVCHSTMSFHQKHQNQMPVRRLKFVAYSMAKAVLEFWRTCETILVSNKLCDYFTRGLVQYPVWSVFNIVIFVRTLNSNLIDLMFPRGWLLSYLLFSQTL